MSIRHILLGQVQGASNDFQWERCSVLCEEGSFNNYVDIFKGKSPEVPFHGITLPYSYFEVIWVFVPIQQEAKHDQEKLSAEQK